MVDLGCACEETKGRSKSLYAADETGCDRLLVYISSLATLPLPLSTAIYKARRTEPLVESADVHVILQRPPDSPWTYTEERARLVSSMTSDLAIDPTSV